MAWINKAATGNNTKKTTKRKSLRHKSLSLIAIILVLTILSPLVTNATAEQFGNADIYETATYMANSMQETIYPVIYDGNGADSGVAPLYGNSDTRFSAGDSVPVLGNVGNDEGPPFAKAGFKFAGWTIDCVCECAACVTDYTINKFDVNLDGVVDYGDYDFFLGRDVNNPGPSYYMIRHDEPAWDAVAQRCDVNNDGKTDMIDLVLILANFTYNTGPVTCSDCICDCGCCNCWDGITASGREIIYGPSSIPGATTHLTMLAKNVILKAVWVQDNATITFYALTGGNVEPADMAIVPPPANPQVIASESMTPPASFRAVPNAGYEFSHWTSSLGFGDLTLQNGLSGINGEIITPQKNNGVYANVNYTANFKQEETYAIIYDGNGADSGVAPLYGDTDTGFAAGDSVPVLGNVGNDEGPPFAKAGHRFAGWTIDCVCECAACVVGDVLSIFDVNLDGVVDYGDYNFFLGIDENNPGPSYYMIRYDDPAWDEVAQRCDVNNDGRTDIIDLVLILANFTSNTGPVTCSDCICDCGCCDCWDGVTDSGRSTIYGPSTIPGAATHLTMLAKNVILKAVWVQEEYTLTIDYIYNDGTTAAQTHTAILAYGEDYNVASPGIPGYTADKTAVTGKMPDDDVNVTVTYTANTYTMPNPGGNTGGGTIIEPPLPPPLYEIHSPYINGYLNDDVRTVRPDGAITRAEAATIIWRQIHITEQALTTNNSPFSDVDSDDWFAVAVNRLAEIGAINGYEDGTFRPNANITRQEFVTIVCRFDPFWANYTSSENPFTDITGSWAYDHIMAAVGMGWIKGYDQPDGTKIFSPEANITRAEVVTVINRVIGRYKVVSSSITLDRLAMYADLAVDHWALVDILEASVLHACLFDDLGYETWVDVGEVDLFALIQ